MAHGAKRCLFAFQISSVSFAFGSHPMLLTHKVFYPLRGRAQSKSGRNNPETKMRNCVWP
ncbi:MAG: hypothetical protein DME91_07400 [Verrucomicrobia bacterium]|nr:MAG: hypothetical protein DME91_07400 [Verrucomicrobiota bacterium]PYK64589.1 MAG: hypothetical protein DME50_12750 [Verrucomicrobiota bacterium]